MHLTGLLLTPLLLAASVLAAVRTTPPPGCLVVSKTPSWRQYSTLSAAVAALSKTTTTEQCIFIYPGTYQEQTYIPALKSPLTLYGSTTDTTSYHSNTVTLTQSLSQDNVPNNDLTATLRAHTPNLRVYNLNLANTRGPGSQALAVSAQAPRQSYHGCRFSGYQDTILANEGAQAYLRCYIDGATDFIFGQRARAWFGGCDIRIKGQGYITANGRDAESNPSYYVLDRCDVQALPGVGSGATYLGRPWREYSRVVVQRSALSNVVRSEGWKIWNTGDERTGNVFYREYGNTGDGARGPRASFAGTLDRPVEIAEVLGSDYASWVDTSYL